MNCPLCNIKLEKAIFYNVEVDYCPQCLGLWFEKDELQQAKDDKDEELRWLDIDIWKDEKNFKVSESKKICPSCSVPLYTVSYGDSDIKIDVCNVCEGIWLDRGEFKKIMDYLREKGKKEILDNYLRNVLEEAKEVFTGPEELREELGDLLAILKVLNYKMAVQYPTLKKLISTLSRPFV